jgi:hypothetical protein
VAAIASAAACVVWRRRRGRAQQVAAAPKGALPSPRLSPKSHSLDSKDGGTGGTDGTACDTVVIHLDSDDASSQAAATASADSAVLAAGGLAPLVGGRGAKAGGGSALAGGIARQRSDVSGSTPGTAHSVLPGGRDNPFNRRAHFAACGCLQLFVKGKQPQAPALRVSGSIVSLAACCCEPATPLPAPPGLGPFAAAVPTLAYHPPEYSGTVSGCRAQNPAPLQLTWSPPPPPHPPPPLPAAAAPARWRRRAAAPAIPRATTSSCPTFARG